MGKGKTWLGLGLVDGAATFLRLGKHTAVSWYFRQTTGAPPSHPTAKALDPPRLHQLLHPSPSHCSLILSNLLLPLAGHDSPVCCARLSAGLQQLTSTLLHRWTRSQLGRDKISRGSNLHFFEFEVAQLSPDVAPRRRLCCARSSDLAASASPPREPCRPLHRLITNAVRFSDHISGDIRLNRAGNTGKSRRSGKRPDWHLQRS